MWCAVGDVPSGQHSRPLVTEREVSLKHIASTVYSSYPGLTTGTGGGSMVWIRVLLGCGMGGGSDAATGKYLVMTQ